MAIAVIGALLSRLAFIASGATVDAAQSAIENPAERNFLDRAILLAVLVGSIWIVNATLNAFNRPLDQTLSLRIARHVEERILAASLTPKSLEKAEDPRFADQIGMAAGVGGPQPAQVVPGASGLVRWGSAWVLAAAILFTFSWWAPLLLAWAMLVQFRWFNRLWKQIYEPLPQAMAHMRKASYLRDITVGPSASKEARLFGLGDWLLERFSGYGREGLSIIWEHRRIRSDAYISIGFTVASQGLVLSLIGLQAATARISIGEFVVFAQAAIALSYTAGTALSSWRYGATTISHLRKLEEMAQEISQDDDLIGRRRTQGFHPSREIRLENVSFRYPGSGKPVLQNLNLSIAAGRSLAIVGENGAGKTTVVKLLTQLYKPSGGQVWIDDVPLNELDPVDWREFVSVIFQDFVRYQLSVRENVAALAPHPKDDEVMEALEKAGATSVVQTMSDGLNTVLSRSFAGADLSGGQWQRIALARALFRAKKGGVLILDEPTANLDVRAEAQLFDRFLDITKGTTTILISHRFSTVRRADHICVLAHGRIVEEGSHEELMTARGMYRKMFELQAERFRSTQDA